MVVRRGFIDDRGGFCGYLTAKDGGLGMHCQNCTSYGIPDTKEK
jgi:hypothetical protein